MAHTSRLRAARTGRRAGRRSGVAAGEAEEARGRNVCDIEAGLAGAPAGETGCARTGTIPGRASAAPGPLPSVAGIAGLLSVASGRTETGPVRAVAGRLDMSTIGALPRGRNWGGGAECGFELPRRAGAARGRDFAAGRRAARARARFGRDGRLEAPLRSRARRFALEVRRAPAARADPCLFDRRGPCALRPLFLRFVLITCRRRRGF